MAVLMLVLASLACNFPFTSAPTPFVFPTPDLTMTAVFNPTITTIPVVPAATALPTDTASIETQIIPTSTPFPTATLPPPTATWTATATTTATVSYVGPGQRPKFSMQAVRFNTPPKIDGSLEDWDLDRYRIENVVFGKSHHQGIDDLSGRAMLGWDGAKLYIGIRVLDDKYVQNATRENLFKGDSLDILLDVDVSGDYHLGALNGDDYQLGISPGSPAPNNVREAYLWFPEAEAGKVDGVSIAARARGDGYVVEASVPWNVFDITPAAGQHYGFAFSISDNDNQSQNVQQSMVSYVPVRVLTDPRTWGDLTLVNP